MGRAAPGRNHAANSDEIPASSCGAREKRGTRNMNMPPQTHRVDQKTENRSSFLILHLLNSRIASLHLEHIALARHHLVKHWIDEEPQEQTRYQSGHYHNRERFLRV